jgi:hypothetical protein
LAAFALAALAAVLVVSVGPSTRASELRYPDLRSIAPSELRFDQARIDGTLHDVLRFTAVSWNAGEGALEVNAAYNTPDGKTVVAQRVFDRSDGKGNFVEFEAGHVLFHPTHRHWHFEKFAAYELWPRADYDLWLASGRQVGGPSWYGTKTTGQGESVCLRDSFQVEKLQGSPRNKRYNTCGYVAQGISVGWGDSYQYFLPDQWIDIGLAMPPDGEYVLRVVADPHNLIYESADKADWARESQENNEAVTYFSHVGGTITCQWPDDVDC